MNGGSIVYFTVAELQLHSKFFVSGTSIIAAEFRQLVSDSWNEFLLDTWNAKRNDLTGILKIASNDIKFETENSYYLREKLQLYICESLLSSQKATPLTINDKHGLEERKIVAARVTIVFLHTQIPFNFVRSAAVLCHNHVFESRLLDLAQKHEIEIECVLRHDRDFDMDYDQILFFKETLLRRIDGKIVELPQHVFMRIALLSFGFNLQNIIKLYDLLSRNILFLDQTSLFFSGATGVHGTEIVSVIPEDSFVSSFSRMFNEIEHFLSHRCCCVFVYLSRTLPKKTETITILRKPQFDKENIITTHDMFETVVSDNETRRGCNSSNMEKLTMTVVKATEEIKQEETLTPILNTCSLRKKGEKFRGMKQCLEKILLLVRHRFSHKYGNSWLNFNSIVRNVEENVDLPGRQITNLSEQRITIQLDVWHYEIIEAIQYFASLLEENTMGKNINKKGSVSVNFEILLPDIFMERVVNKKNWMLFSPEYLDDVKQLTNFEQLNGLQFKRVYEFVEKSLSTKLVKDPYILHSQTQYYKTLPAENVWLEIIKAQSVCGNKVNLVFKCHRIQSFNPNPFRAYCSPEVKKQLKQSASQLRGKQSLKAPNGLHELKPVNNNMFREAQWTSHGAPSFFFASPKFAYINISKFVVNSSQHGSSGQRGTERRANDAADETNRNVKIIDLESLANTAEFVVEVIDNLIDITNFSDDIRSIATKNFRPINVQLNNICEFLDSIEVIMNIDLSIKILSLVFDTVSFATSDASCKLAYWRGRYKLFQKEEHLSLNVERYEFTPVKVINRNFGDWLSNSDTSDSRNRCAILTHGTIDFPKKCYRTLTDELQTIISDDRTVREEIRKLPRFDLFSKSIRFPADSDAASLPSPNITLTTLNDEIVFEPLTISRLPWCVLKNKIRRIGERHCCLTGYSANTSQRFFLKNAALAEYSDWLVFLLDCQNTQNGIKGQKKTADISSIDALTNVTLVEARRKRTFCLKNDVYSNFIHSFSFRSMLKRNLKAKSHNLSNQCLFETRSSLRCFIQNHCGSLKIPLGLTTETLTKEKYQEYLIETLSDNNLKAHKYGFQYGVCFA